MNKGDIEVLRNKIAALESRIDLLETEFSYLNRILIDCGFANGIETLKMTVEEVISEKLDLPSMKINEEEEL